MAVTDPQTRASKKSKHKKSSRSENINKPKKRNELSGMKSGSVYEEQHELETDSDKSSIELPQQPKTISNLQAANGDISDSDTDIDKPPKVAYKSTIGTRSYHSQSVVQRSDTEENEDSDDSEDEPQSVSLLQMHSAKLSPERKSSHHGVNNSQRKSLPASGTLKGKVTRRPNVPEMSPSESEEDDEYDEDETPKTHSQTHRLTAAELQPESISDKETEEEDEEEEEEEVRDESHNQQRYRQQQHPETITALDPSVRIKEEVDSDYSSSCDADDPSPMQEFQSTSLYPSGEPSDVNLPIKTSPQNPSAIELDQKHLSDIVTFEQEHTRVSAPVIDIPHDSRVWVLQVPRSIEAAHLCNQYLPKKLKGDEVLNLPSGRWQILEEQFEASKSVLNCIVSTGHLCYGMRWLQPRGFWFLKHMRTPIQMETADEPWKEEVAPLPIKEVLKMKSNPAFSKVQHMKPSKKRVRDSGPDLPSKKIKEELNTSKDETKHRKKKHHHAGFSPNELSSMQGGETEKGKKRKFSYDVNEVSPTKKKKKKDSSMDEDGQREPLGTSCANINRTMNLSTEENISFSKKENKKKNKHQEKGYDSVKRFNFLDSDVKVKQENIDNDDEWGDNSSPCKISESPKKQKRRHGKQVAEDDHFMETKQLLRTTIEKEKKEKEKLRVDTTGKPIKIDKKSHSQQNERSFEDADSDVRKKKKHKHHQNRMEDEVSVQKSEEDKATDISLKKKKKKKHKHKSSDRPKVKQEGFWDRETSPDYLKRLYLTQVTPEDL